MAREAEGKEGRAELRVEQSQQASISPCSGCRISCCRGFSGCITCTGLTRGAVAIVLKTQKGNTQNILKLLI